MEVKSPLKKEEGKAEEPKLLAAPKLDPRVEVQGDKPLPADFVIPAKATRIIVDPRGTIHIDW